MTVRLAPVPATGLNPMSPGPAALHHLFRRQLAKATAQTGHVDLNLLADLVGGAYRDAERDRARTNRSIELMGEELRQANARLLEAFDVVPEGLVLLDPQGRYVLFNKRFVELYDLIRDQIFVGGSFAESVRVGIERGQYIERSANPSDFLANRIGQLQEQHSSSEQHLNGGRWVRVEERRTRDGGSIGVRIDITDLKRREEALQKRSEQLLEAQRLGRMADWTYEFGRGGIDWSSQVFELLRYDPETSRTGRRAVLSLMVADGARRVRQAQSQVLRTGAVTSTDAQLRRGDGSLGDFVIVSKLTRNDKGRATGFSGTIQDITERKDAERALERLAYYDPLTGLANRALFLRDLKAVFAPAGNAATASALFILDLDRFKEVNDTLGHVAGDKALIEVSRLMSQILGRDHRLSRLGGDEFAVIIRGETSLAVIKSLAAELILNIHRSIMIDGCEIDLGTSIGIALIPQDGSNVTDVQRNADLALYQAKESGRNCFRFFDPKMSEVVLHKLALARDLRHALHQDNELAAHYQPQIDLRTDLVIGYEALLRWNHPTRGAIPPSEFIPIAESSQVICDLGRWILRQAVVQAKHWLDLGEIAREISVNVSAAQIWNTDFVRDVAQVLKDTGLPPHLLCLELTESLLVRHGEMRVETVLKDLKKLGVTLALDDFGTDYSSLGYLTRLPFDKLKIDRIFVNGVVSSSRARNLLEGIVALGRGLGMTILVEGAETAEEVDLIRGLRADQLQGFAFSRATAADQALAFAHSLASARRYDPERGTRAQSGVEPILHAAE